MTEVVVFDVDGVLVDTRDLVRRAYRAAGVEQPDDVWHHPWRSWLPDLVDGDFDVALEIHMQKNLEYERMLAMEIPPVLPPGELAKMLHAQDHIDVSLYALSSGSYRAVRSALDAANIPVMLVGAELLPDEKRHLLKRVSLRGGVYIDDNGEFKVPPRWRFVHYTNQSMHELLGEVVGVQWTP